MDRRKRKTRSAIFSAFIGLLSEKPLERITVAEVIDRADVGRATFYAHFETREHLLQELCRELFDHLFHREQTGGLFSCEDTGSAFSDLLGHICRDDNHLGLLLSGQNRQVFLEYFKQELYTLVQSHQHQFPTPAGLPEELWIRQICAVFVETVDWSLQSNLTPDQAAQYFFAPFDNPAQT